MAALLAVAAGCGGGGWVETAPDVAARARDAPDSFVPPTLAQWDGIELLTATYRVRASEGVRSTTLDALVFARPPGLLHVALLGADGASYAALVAGEQEVALWDGREGVVYRGANLPGAFGRALGLELTEADAVAVLLGLGLPRARFGDADAAWDQERQRIRLVDSRGAEVWLHPLNRRFEEVRFPTATSAVVVELADWRGDAAPIPGSIDIRITSEGLRVELERTSLQDVPYDPEMFVLEPRGATEQPLESLSRDGGLLRRGLRR